MPSCDPLRVLAVDDDPFALALLVRHLSSAGHQVLTARNGKEALKVLLEEGAPMVITDWSMPEMDGLQLCRTIRIHEGIPFTYVIVLTANTEEDHTIDAFEAGTDDYLAKPFRERELLARVQAGQRIIRLREDLERRSRDVHHSNAELAVANEKLAEANHRLNHMATTDELTGLLNRREALNRLYEYWSTSLRHGDPLSCIAIDIDHFKNFNDRYGHATGDWVLRETAAVLRRTARRGESVCRLGGEEFLILCPKATHNMAAVGAERLRLAVESNRLVGGGSSLNVTVSLGVAERTLTMSGHDDLLRAADTALYEAKNAGRNTVRVANSGRRQEGSSDPRGGSFFAADERTSAAAPVHEQIKVLVADEDADSLHTCVTELRRAGYGVLEAARGTEALQRAEIDLPDVIVLDVGLSDISGMECARRLTSHPRTRDLPLILMTDHVGEFGMDFLGVVEYLRKPLQPQELVLRVRTMARFRKELSHSNAIRGEQTRALDLLLTFSRDIAGADSLDAILDATNTAAATLTCSRRVCILMPDLQHTALAVARSLGIENQALSRIRVPLGSPTTGEVFTTRETKVLHSPEEARHRRQDPDYELFPGTPTICTALCAPECVVGVLVIAGRPDASPFSPLDLEYVDLICNIAASAIHDCQTQRARDEARDSIVVALAKLAEFRDTDTGKHLDRVTQFCTLLALQLREEGRQGATIDDEFLADLARAVPLHDIGKVAVPDHILRKPGRLDDDEVRVMQTHAEIGAMTIRSVIDRAPGARFLEMAEQIAWNHHEWYNGRGYPRGLKGQDIPLAARIVAVADVYDALTTKRIYKDAMPHEKACDIIVQSSGSQFDPDLVEAFRRCAPEVARLARELADRPESAAPAKSAKLRSSRHENASVLAPLGV